MAEILCVYRQIAMLQTQSESGHSEDGSEANLAIISDDEKPGIQVIGATAPDRPPLPAKARR